MKRGEEEEEEEEEERRKVWIYDFEYGNLWNHVYFGF